MIILSFNNKLYELLLSMNKYIYYNHKVYNNTLIH